MSFSIPDSNAEGWPRVRRCLYVGQLHPDKGVHTAIEAVHRLAETFPSLSLSIVGRGQADYCRRLNELAERGPAKIEFLGALPHDEVSAIYQRHDLLLFPSIWAEPFGLTHLEAMASGLPVISTPHGGQGEMLEAEKSALLAGPGDVAEWAWHIRRLAQSPDLARRIAKAGHALVKGSLNLESYVDQLENWLSECHRGWQTPGTALELSEEAPAL